MGLFTGWASGTTVGFEDGLIPSWMDTLPGQEGTSVRIIPTNSYGPYTPAGDYSLEINAAGNAGEAHFNVQLVGTGTLELQLRYSGGTKYVTNVASDGIHHVVQTSAEHYDWHYITVPLFDGLNQISIEVDTGGGGEDDFIEICRMDFTGTSAGGSSGGGGSSNSHFAPDSALTFENGQIPSFLTITGRVYGNYSTADWGVDGVGTKALMLFNQESQGAGVSGVNGVDGATSGGVGTLTYSFGSGVPSVFGTTGLDHVKTVDASSLTELGTPITDNNVLKLAGDGADGSTRYIQRQLTWAEDGVLGLDLALRSESGYDFASILIDGTEVWRQSGLVTWQHLEFPVTAGSHNVALTYGKDSSQSVGYDGFFIDNLAFTNVYSDDVVDPNGPTPAPHTTSAVELSVVSTGDAIVDTLLSWNLNTDGVGRILLDGTEVQAFVGGEITNNQYSSYTVPVPEGVHVVRWEVTNGDLGGQNVGTIDQIHVTGTTPDGYTAGWSHPGGAVDATGTVKLTARLRGRARNSEDPIEDVSATGTARMVYLFIGENSTEVQVPEASASATVKITAQLFSGFFIEIEVPDEAELVPDPEDDPNSPDVIPDV